MASVLNLEPSAAMASRFPWAERLSPRMLKSPWWIGHIPFAYELIGRLRPGLIVELGTYSGSSFVAFCQAAEACGASAHCYGVDLWKGDIHMGRFDDSLYREIADYVAAHYRSVATLVRKTFDEAVNDFADDSVDLLHIDGTHTYEAVANDFNTWKPKLSDRSVVMFHDTNVTKENVGAAAQHFGVRRFFDEVRFRYPHFEFAHCYGLGVLVTGERAAAEILELAEFSKDPAFAEYFARKGEAVSQAFQELNVALAVHAPYTQTPLWRKAVNRVHDIVRRGVG